MTEKESAYANKSFVFSDQRIACEGSRRCGIRRKISVLLIEPRPPGELGRASQQSNARKTSLPVF